MIGCNPEHLAGVQQGYYLQMQAIYHLPVNLCLSTRGPASLYVFLTMHSAPSYSVLSFSFSSKTCATYMHEHSYLILLLFIHFSLFS